MKDDLEVINRELKDAQRFEKKTKAGQRTESALMGGERLCFVITKRRSHSWADDLHACEHRTDLDKIYH